MGTVFACGRCVVIAELLEERRLLADVSGVIFSDLNGDGVREAGEAVAANRVVFVDLNNNGQPDVGERTARTDSRGVYRFSNLPAGKSTVREVLPTGSEQTSPSGTASGAFYAAKPAGTGLKINILPGPTLAANPIAMATVRAATAQWERLFSDPVS